MLDMTLVETGPLRGQGVQIGRGRQGMAVAAYTLGAQFIGHKEDEVHFMELNPVTALLVQLINEDNGLTTKQMLDVIVEKLSLPDPEAVFNGGYQIIQDLKNRNVILGVSKSSM